MGKSFDTKGIVLSEMTLSESDKRLLIFTPEYGKLTVFSKGCKKPTSKLLAVSQLFVYSQMELVEGRNAHTLINGEVIEAFYSVREDLLQASYGMYFLEFINRYTEEGNKEAELYELLLRTLYQLKSHHIGFESLQTIFEIKALGLLGYPVQTDKCGHCGSTTQLEGIHLEAGQTLCVNCCTRKDPHFLKMTNMGLEGICFLQQVTLKDLYKHQLNQEMGAELGEFVTRFSLIHLGKPLKTKEFLRTFKALE